MCNSGPQVTGVRHRAMVNGATWTVGLVALVSAGVSLVAQGGPYERQRIDQAAEARGRAVYARYCINCHGSTAKGSDRGPDLIRSVVVLRDRLGSGIGPALKSPAHQPTMTGAQVVDLSHFLHGRIEAVARNRTPTAPLDVLTGDPEAGRSYFFGAGTCSTCHQPTGDLAGIATRMPNLVNLQQRFLFPTLAREGNRKVEVTVSPAAGPVVNGQLLYVDDFSVSLRDASGEYRGFTRGPDVKVVVHDPLEAHYQLLDRYTDENMHDLTAYLSTLK